MSRPRDSQRSKVYKAQVEFEDALDGRNRGWTDIHAVRVGVEWMVGSRWWQTRFPHVKGVLVKDRRGRRYPGGAPPRYDFISPEGMITLPRACRRKTDVLHELAHVVAPIDEAWHSPAFVSCYLALVDEYLGKMEALAFRWFLAKNESNGRSSHEGQSNLLCVWQVLVLD